MLLSTSNSDQQNWWVTWLITTVLFLSGVIGYENFLKEQGFKPSVEANRDLWSWNRREVQNNGDAIALVGASRMQLGVDTAVMREQLLNYQIIPLSINGQYPVATLKALSEDASFRGVVLMSFMAQMLEPRYWDMQLEYNHYFATGSSLYLSSDAYLTAQLKSKLRLFNPLLGLKELVKSLGSQTRFPKPFYVNGQADSSARGNYDLTDVAALKEHFIKDKLNNYKETSIMSQQVWLQQLKKIHQYIKTIRLRGGEVVLVRFPTDDMHWLLDEQYYPRALFWNTINELYPDVLAIHFKDDEVLRSFELPDSSHLDQKDTPRFTLRLIQLIQNLGLLKNQMVSD